jgi:hypothetical protein
MMAQQWEDVFEGMEQQIQRLGIQVSQHGITIGRMEAQ